MIVIFYYIWLFVAILYIIRNVLIETNFSGNFNLADLAVHLNKVTKLTIFCKIIIFSFMPFP